MHCSRFLWHYASVSSVSHLKFMLHALILVTQGRKALLGQEFSPTAAVPNASSDNSRVERVLLWSLQALF